MDVSRCGSFISFETMNPEHAKAFLIKELPRLGNCLHTATDNQRGVWMDVSLRWHGVLEHNAVRLVLISIGAPDGILLKGVGLYGAYLLYQFDKGFRGGPGSGLRYRRSRCKKTRSEVAVYS